MAVEIFSLLLDLDMVFLTTQVNKWMGKSRLRLPFFINKYLILIRHIGYLLDTCTINTYFLENPE